MTKVAVIGAAGAMGKWSLNQLINGQLKVLEPTEIFVYDTNVAECLKVVQESRILLANSNPEAVQQADLVILSVPIEAAASAVEEIAPHMKPGSLLMDITSVKTEVCRKMIEKVPSNVELISCHPMFGPRFEDFSGRVVVLIKIRSSIWYPKIKAMFHSFRARVIECTVEEHDKMMAVVQGLTHFTHIVSAAVIAEFKLNLQRTEELASPPFEVFLSLMFRITHENPGLYAHIQAYNPYVKDAQSLFIKKAKTFSAMTETRDIKQMVEYIKSAAEGLGHTEPTVDRHLRMSQIVASALQKERKRGESLIGKRICLREAKTGRIHCGMLRKLTSDKMTIEESKRRMVDLNMFKYEILDENSCLRERQKKFGGTKRDVSAFFPPSLSNDFLVETVKRFIKNLTNVEGIDTFMEQENLNRKSICIRIHFPADEEGSLLQKQLEDVLTSLGGTIR